MSKQSWRLAAGTLLSVGLLWLAARGVSWSEVAVALGAARWNLIAVGVVSVFLATVLRAWCWRSLLFAPAAPVTVVHAWKIVLIGQFLNFCLPARAGDFTRVYLMSNVAGMSRAGTAASLVLEKFFDATTLLLLFAPVALFVELPPELENVGRGFAGGIVLLLLIVVALVWQRSGLVKALAKQADGDDGWVAWLARQTATIVESLKVIQSWHRLALMQAGYLGNWLALAGVNYVVLRGLEVGAPVVAAFVVLGVVQVGMNIPSTPGKIGVFQYITVLALVPFGVERELALTYGVLLHLVEFGPVVVLGGLWWWTGVTDRR